VASLRGALGDQGDEEVHFVDEGFVVGAGQLVGLVLVRRRLVLVHIDDAVLHARLVAQVLGQGAGVERVLAVLRGTCELCSGDTHTHIGMMFDTCQAL